MIAGEEAPIEAIKPPEGIFNHRKLVPSGAVILPSVYPTGQGQFAQLSNDILKHSPSDNFG